VVGVIETLINIYSLVLLVAIIASWVNADPYNPIVRFLRGRRAPADARATCDAVRGGGFVRPRRRWSSCWRSSSWARSWCARSPISPSSSDGGLGGDWLMRPWLAAGRTASTW
jgi:hypothetical protein